MASKTKTVAVVGASDDPAKYGHKAVLAYQRAGWTVYPVNPNVERVAGLICYKSVRDIPVDRLDRVTLYLPPRIGVTVLEDIASRKPDELFVNPGAESDELLEKARRLGLEPIEACSILAIGMEPDEL